MTRAYLSFIYIIGSLAVLSCHNGSTGREEEETPEQVQTPVTVTNVSNEPLTEYAELNATSVFQQDNIIKSNITGYIKTVNIKVGQFVSAGQTLFILKTKEAESLGNTIDNAVYTTQVAAFGYTRAELLDVLRTLDSPTVSRRHARISISASGASLEDLDSKNGTFLRAERVSTAVPLADGDEIRVGSVVLRFRTASGSRTATWTEPD